MTALIVRSIRGFPPVGIKYLGSQSERWPSAGRVTERLSDHEVYRTWAQHIDSRPPRPNREPRAVAFRRPLA
jgi:hypothetical protein